MSETERLERLVADELGDCCPDDVEERREELRALAESVPRERVEADVATLGTLADDTRYRLTRVLAAGGERCVCELEGLVAVGESAVSHALGDLVDAGLVTRRKEGKWRYYDTTDRAEALFSALDEVRETGGRGSDDATGGDA